MPLQLPPALLVCAWQRSPGRRRAWRAQVVPRSMPMTVSTCEQAQAAGAAVSSSTSRQQDRFALRQGGAHLVIPLLGEAEGHHQRDGQYPEHGDTCVVWRGRCVSTGYRRRRAAGGAIQMVSTRCMVTPVLFGVVVVCRQSSPSAAGGALPALTRQRPVVEKSDCGIPTGAPPVNPVSLPSCFLRSRPDSQ